MTYITVKIKEKVITFSIESIRNFIKLEKIKNNI